MDPQPAADLQLVGHFRGVYTETPEKTEFSDEKRWTNFCIQTMRMTEAPQIDFSQREVYVIDQKVAYSGSNYLALKEWSKDPKTNEYFVICCNVIEEISANAMGYCKLVISVPRRAKINVVWLKDIEAYRFNEELTNLDAKKKNLTKECANYKFISAQITTNHIMCSPKTYDDAAQNCQLRIQELVDQVRRYHTVIRKQLAGPCLNN